LQCSNGSSNTAIGAQALYTNAANNNTAVGRSALRNNTTGANNLSLGTNAGCCITTGACNVILGSATANGFGTQNNNIFISDGAGNIRMFVTGSDGSVGVNTTTPAYTFDVNGTGRFVAIIETSTERLKENIEPYTTEVVKFMELNPVKFTWKESGAQDVGLIAEEVEKLFPEFVSKDQEGSPTGINYSKLATIFINMLKEHQNKILELEQEIKKLKE